jgi:hypothetical protein
MPLPFVLVFVLEAAPVVTPARAEALLFSNEPAVPRCDQPGTTDAERIACLLALRYHQDPKAAKLAQRLFEAEGSIAGLTDEQDFDGGFRGVIHVVPDLPIGPKRQYLDWVVQAFADFDAVLGALPTPADAGARAPYRWHGLELGFFQSLKRRTPAAWANGWSVHFNTVGTLNQTPDAVRELLFHEVFHLNDQAHGDWSRVLSNVYEKVLWRCGTKRACLEPWAPVETITKGTYYAFLPANGVHEYTAELATRYYREQRLRSRGLAVAQPFKCRNAENALVWSLLKAEFFANVDLVPACPQPP